MNSMAAGICSLLSFAKPPHLLILHFLEFLNLPYEL